MKIVARGHIAAGALCIRWRMSTAGKSEYARVLGPYHSPNRVHTKINTNKKLSYRQGTARCVVSDCQLKSCQLPHNSTETTYTTSLEQIEDMKLKGYSRAMCNKHVHSTMTRLSRFHCPVGVINKPTTDNLWRFFLNYHTHFTLFIQDYRH